MQGFFRRIGRTREHHALATALWSMCALVSTLACTGPRQFGRSSSAPMPSALGGGSPVIAQRAPTMLRAARPVQFAPPLYADETRAGEPWAGLQLAMQPSPQGIFVGEVSYGSPAEAAGIQAGDYIFQLDGQTVRDAQDVLAEIARVGVGGSLRLGVHRGERVRLFRVEPVARPPEAAAQALPAEPPSPSAALDGSEAPAPTPPAAAPATPN
jgi:membrane-associated protease RseP (regulator of RpoE activity)